MTHTKAAATQDACRRITRYGLHRLILFIRSRGGVVTARYVYRHGQGCRCAADAQTKLDMLVQLHRGTWRFEPSGNRGGRPQKKFVLREMLRTRAPIADSELENALNCGVNACAHARELAFDLVELILAHKASDTRLSPEEIDQVLRELRESLSSILSPHYRPSKTPVRPPADQWMSDAW